MAFMKKERNPLKSFVKGFVTGFVEAVICYPTEFVKTQLQLQSKANPEYSGIMDCVKKVVKGHGPLALYRGAMPLIIGSSVKQMVRWSTYSNVSGVFRKDDNSIDILPNMFSGACAGAAEATFAVTPIETLKNRCIDDIRRGTNKYTGSFDAMMKIIRSEGLGGLYMGLAPTIAKQGTNQMVRFPIQQMYFQLFFGGDPEKKKNPFLNGLCGAAAGGTSVVLTMPQDTIKTRMQGEEAKALYKGTLDCIKQTVKKEGVRFLWTGTWPRFVRVTLDVGITFTIYPLIGQYLDKMWH